MAKKNFKPTPGTNLSKSRLSLNVASTLGNTPIENSVVDQTWEELEDIYQETAKGIVTTGQNINEVIAAIGQGIDPAKVNELNIAVKGLGRDLEVFSKDLAKIHKAHENKTGLIKTTDDLALSINVFDSYVNFNTLFKSVTLPTVITILDHVGVAAQTLVDNQVKTGSETSVQETTEESTTNTNDEVPGVNNEQPA